MGELEGYAKIRDEKTGIEAGPYDAIWRSDSLISSEISTALFSSVKPLEDVPDAEKDWHPGSNGQVLDLIHPSICPLVYGETYGKLPDGTYSTFLPDDEFNERDAPFEFISQRFQWLPSDFSVSASGEVSMVSGYINNLHPIQEPTLLPIILRIMETAAIPLWTRVLSDLRTAPSKPSRFNNWSPDKCIWNRFPPSPSEEEAAQVDDDWVRWRLNQVDTMTLPDSPPVYEGALDQYAEPVLSLKGRDIQVIVKMANIMLTPEKPEYGGGKWHVEGQCYLRIIWAYYADRICVQGWTMNVSYLLLFITTTRRTSRIRNCSSARLLARQWYTVRTTPRVWRFCISTAGQ